MSVHADIGKAVNDRAERAAKRHRQATLGTVIGLAPFRVELHDTNDVLTATDEDFVMTQWVRFYDHVFGIALGDNAVVDLRHGVHVWHDVLAATAITPPWT